MGFIEFNNVVKKYRVGDSEIIANDNISFSIEEGELCCIIGPSGAGKSTVLNILGGMDRCDSGKIIVDGKDITSLSKNEMTKYRRFDIGFVFQFYNLIPNLTVIENLEIASHLVQNSLDPKEVLKDVGLESRMNNFPSQISGGEQQRVAIARAIVKKPKLLLCDEPTGALDYVTGKRILSLLHSICKTTGKTVIIITHNLALKEMADRVIEINDSKIRKIEKNDKPKPIEEIEW